MKTSLDQFFKVSYTEDGIPIYHLGESTKLQKLHQRAWLESGEWIRGQAPLDKIEYNNNLVYLYTNLGLFATLNRGISIQPHEPGAALDMPGMPSGQKDVFFRVREPQTEICFFLRCIETSPAKTTILVYFPFDDGQGVLWKSLRTHLIGDETENLTALSATPAPLVEQPPEEQKSHDAKLSDREEDIADLLADGLTQKQISSQLFITPSTVKKHADNIAKKLNIKHTGKRYALALREMEYGTRKK